MSVVVFVQYRNGKNNRTLLKFCVFFLKSYLIISKSLFSPRVPFDFSVSFRASFFVEVHINDLRFVQPGGPWRLPCDQHKSFNLSLLACRNSRLERQSPCVYGGGIQVTECSAPEYKTCIGWAKSCIGCVPFATRGTRCFVLRRQPSRFPTTHSAIRTIIGQKGFLLLRIVRVSSNGLRV